MALMELGSLSQYDVPKYIQEIKDTDLLEVSDFRKIVSVSNVYKRFGNG